MSFPDRFELLEPLCQDEVETFRARERASSRSVEAHFFGNSPDLLARLENLSEPQRNSVIDQGSHDGKFYVVTAPLAGGFREWLAPGLGGLESAGSWRITPVTKPSVAPASEAPPGDFTKMFQLRQAPVPVAAPASKSSGSKEPAPASKPGEFTRVFQKPAMAPSAAPRSSPAPGEPGEFTRMFQKPAQRPAEPAPPVPQTPDNSVPAPAVAASQSKGAGSTAPVRTPQILIVVTVIFLFVIAVFLLVRKLY